MENTYNARAPVENQTLDGVTLIIILIIQKGIIIVITT